MPFPIESSLSGVQRGVTPQEALWYETTFEVPAAWRRGNDVLLHFGAVDWRAEVYVNDLLVGSHTGGYTPFSFDITPALSAKGVQKLTVKVTDSTDKGFQPHGKQVLEPHGIWYTPVTGIWQTVWIEPVPAANHIAGITTRSDIRAGVLSVDVKTARTGSDRVCVTLSADGKTLAERSSMAGQPVHLTANEYRLVELLSRSAGKVLTYDRISEAMWDDAAGGNSQLLRVNMANIRRKLEQNPAEPQYILTEIGVGYRMKEPG